MKNLKIAQFAEPVKAEMAAEYFEADFKRLFYTINHATKTSAYIVETETAEKSFKKLKAAIKYFNRQCKY